MGTGFVKNSVQKENYDIPSVPPGFEAFISIKDSFKRGSDDLTWGMPFTSFSETQSVRMDMETDGAPDVKMTRSLRPRRCIDYGLHDNYCDDVFDCERDDQNFSSKPVLPKGVIRGCAECSTCQKVTARWRPEESRSPDTEDAPIFYPTEEEFEDTLQYIASIREKAEPYGICCIVPPSSWKPPCLLQEQMKWASSKFATRVQRIDKLQNRYSLRKLSRLHNQMKRKRRRCAQMEVDCADGDGDLKDAASFGFEPGLEFTLETFKKYADDFATQYFSGTDIDSSSGINLKENYKPSVENIEGEYWRIVEKPTEEIEVLYGADIETGVFGSGFPKVSDQFCLTSDEKYVKSGWNLNSFPRLPGSLLSHESNDISGILVPWLYVGMCFSSFCWHVEDHHLYSLNYLHWGMPKIWYGVPEKDADKLEDAMRKHLPDLFEEQPDLLQKLVTQLSPSILKSEGVPVFRCIQNPGQFVLTFPRAYHSGFNCGFNCAEAVNFAPVDWLPHGQIAVELYRQLGRRTTISHDKLLFGAAREAVKAQWELNLLKKSTSHNLRWQNVCGKDSILVKSFKKRVEMECTRRDTICGSAKALKMESSFDATKEKECSLCFFDLHLSAVGCHCSPDKYACLNHMKQFCSCPHGARIFLFRYDIKELNILVEALEGRLSAIYRWARLDLGLALSSHISRENICNERLTKTFEGAELQDSAMRQSISDLVKEVPKTSTGIAGDISSLRDDKSSAATSPLKVEELVSKSLDLLKEIEKMNHDFNGTVSHLRSTSCELLRNNRGHCVKEVSERGRVGKASVRRSKRAIVLSENEGDDEAKGLVLNKEEEIFFAREVEKADSLAEANTKARLCNYDNDANLMTPLTEAAQICSSWNIHCDSDSDGDDMARNVKVHPSSNFVGTERSIHENFSCAENSLNRFVCQKGPRIAEPVRRNMYKVEPLEFGVVVSGKCWSNSQSIFPKGFKSRVWFISVLDPTKTSCYVSEILDAGLDGPLFMVSMAQCRTEVFIHVSPARCWELVREKVNQEISKHHALGITNLPPLQPPTSLDGFEMFGFTSPAIVQIIEAMDRNQVCTEYWDSRPHSWLSQSATVDKFQQTASVSRTNDGVVAGANTNRRTRRLFKKANLDELYSLRSILREKK